MTDQFVLDFYAAALVITLATYPTVKMMRVTARDARLAAKAAARKRALFATCDPACGAGVAKAVKLEPPGDDRLKGASATDEPEETSAAN